MRLILEPLQFSHRLLNLFLRLGQRINLVFLNFRDLAIDLVNGRLENDLLLLDLFQAGLDRSNPLLIERQTLPGVLNPVLVIFRPLSRRFQGVLGDDLVRLPLVEFLLNLK